MGDRRASLEEAAWLTAERVGSVVASSQVRETGPWGEMAGEGEAQDFLNQVLVVETSLSPEQLLEATQQIEKELGRERKKEFCNSIRRRYRPRTIDIDILFYEDTLVSTPRLTVPHPLIAEREFVLEPLAEVLPGLRHPVTGMTATEMLEALKQRSD